jgi:two-component sensor histidine kinase
LSIDRALPVGLILNEIAMNSIKHAFGSDGGRIVVRLVGGVGFGEARLTVSESHERPGPGRLAPPTPRVP